MQIDVHVPSLTDNHVVPDIFATGLGPIEEVGGDCHRYVLYAQQKIAGEDQFVVVARIIVPRQSVPAILYLAARNVGLSLVRAARGVRGAVN